MYATLLGPANAKARGPPPLIYVAEYVEWWSPRCSRPFSKTKTHFLPAHQAGGVDSPRAPSFWTLLGLNGPCWLLNVPFQRLLPAVNSHRGGSTWRHFPGGNSSSHSSASILSSVAETHRLCRVCFVWSLTTSDRLPDGESWNQHPRRLYRFC